MRRAMMLATMFLGGCLIGCESIQNAKWTFGIQSASETEADMGDVPTSRSDSRETEPTPEPEGG